MEKITAKDIIKGVFKILLAVILFVVFFVISMCLIDILINKDYQIMATIIYGFGLMIITLIISVSKILKILKKENED